MRAFVLLPLLMLVSINTLAEPSSSVGQPVPPAFFEIAHCDVVTNKPSASKVSFDIYVKMSAIEQKDILENAPGAIVWDRIPLFGKILYTSARVSLSALNNQPVKFKAEVDQGDGEAIILKADLFAVNNSFTGTGTVELDAKSTGMVGSDTKGNAPVQCTLEALEIIS